MAEEVFPVTVFAGPCLPPSDPSNQDLLDGIQVKPPARRGDVLRALGEQPRVLVLLDGYYRTVPAVTHKELLYALDSGVRVVGAASMGALRAAELEACGMVGVGTVFEWFREGRIEGDDEVAIVHAPREFEYRPSTVALVELRHWAEVAVGRGRVDALAVEELLAKVQLLPFFERSIERITGLATSILDARTAGSLADALARPVLKRQDTRQALEVALRLAEEAPAAEPSSVMPPTSRFLGHYRAWHLGPGPDLPTYQQAWSLVQLLHPEAKGFVRRLNQRFLLVSAATHGGLEPPAGQLARFESQLIDRLGASPGGRLRLPRAEIVEEARQHALAEMALETWGLDGACRTLARAFGLETATPVADLLEWLEASRDLLPVWYRVRAFVGSSVRDAAIRAACEGLRIWTEFRRQAGEGELEGRDLERLVARWWNCAPGQVSEQASRRGLYESDRFAEGWRSAVERWVVAELAMSRDEDSGDWGGLLGNYPRLRAELLRAPMRYVLDGRSFALDPGAVADPKGSHGQ